MFFRTLTLSLTALLLASCAQEKPYEESEYKTEALGRGALFKKEDVNFCTLEDPCLWAPSVADTNKDVTASRPYSMGTPKLVITRITEDKLEILEIEQEDRFDDNINNFTPVAHFDIEHVDFRCKKDSLDKCTNAEEKDEEKHWSKRRYVEITDKAIDEVNTLPIELDTALGSNCVSSESVGKININDPELIVEAKTAINFGLKTHYSAKAGCAAPLREFRDLSNLNFFVDHNYSLVKLSSVADPNYKPLVYPASDERYFGFFTTEQVKMTPDYRDDLMGTRNILANRWSPNKSEVVYYLNETFYKPEMKPVLDSTIAAIETVNESLARTGAKLRIKLENGTGKNPGDLRNNFLVLVKDPQASGVIGYGPSIASPLTGEIIHARTVMYYGTIIKFLTRAYDERIDAIADEVATQAAAAAANNAANAGNSSRSTSDRRAFNDVMSSVINANINTNKLDLERSLNVDSIAGLGRNLNRNQVSNVIDSIREEMSLLSSHNHDVTIDDVKESLDKKNDLMAKFSEKTFFHAEMFNFEGAVGASLQCLRYAEEEQGGDIPVKDRTYIKWDNLDKEQQEAVLTCLMPNVWVPTLVHEFGHNLGLRHNFYGSKDKENYFTTGERAARNLPMDLNVTYSSIMDYAYSTINELSIMGKYDEAALGYAYAGKVELKSEDTFVTLDGNITQFPERQAQKILASRGVEVTDLTKVTEAIERMGQSTQSSMRAAAAAAKVAMEKAQAIKSEIKRYAYCSDEHVGTDETCNRFDEGSNAKEVAEHYIAAYKKNYERLNFRGTKRDFSGRSGDWNYFIRQINTLSNVRVFFDRYDQAVFRGDFEEEFMSKPEEELTEQEKSQKERLVDLKAASDVAFDGLMDIVETPSYHCIEFDPQVGQLGRVLPFNKMAEGTQLQDFGITFDIRFGCEILTNFARQDDDPSNDKYVYLSAGKYFNNSLDLTISNRDLILQGDTSQIDVRGFWQDKMAAAYMLSSRFQSPTSIGAASNGSFLDYPEYKERFIKFMDGLLSNKFEITTELTFNGNTVGSAPITVGFEGNHEINKSYNPIVNFVFGLDNTQNNFKTVLMGLMKDKFKVPQNVDGIDSDIKIYHDFDAYTQSGASGFTKLTLEEVKRRYGFDKVVDFKSSVGEVTSRFGLYSYNSFALKLAATKDIMDQVNNLAEEQAVLLDAVIKAVQEATSQADIQAALALFGEDNDFRTFFINNVQTIMDAKTGVITMKSLENSFKALANDGNGIL